MYIGIFSDNFYPELSGIADTILHTGRELAKRGHFITYFVPHYPEESFALVGRPYRELELGERIKIVRFGSFGYPTGTGQGRFVVPTFLRWLGMRNLHLDIVHVHLPFGPGLEGVAAARALRIPLVGTNHTPVKEFVRYSPIHAEWFYRAIVKYDTWFYSKCDFVSSPCKDIFTEMKANGFNRPHRVVPNPVDTERFKPSHEKISLKKKFNFSKFTVLYSGRLAKEKSIDVLLRAVAEARRAVPDITLALTGRGAAEAELKALAEKLEISSAVRFLGFIEEQALPEIYAASDVFAIASTSETQSIAAAQGMATGIPVIGVRAWGLKDYIKPELGFLAEPGNAKEIASYIVRLAHSPALREKLGKEGRVFAKTLTPHSIAETWETIYRNTEELHKNHTFRT